MKDVKEAESVFGRLRRAYPRSAAAGASYLELAAWFEASANWARAAEIYGLARGNLPKSEGRQRAVLGLGNAWRELGRKAEALALFTELHQRICQQPLPGSRMAAAWAAPHADLNQNREAPERVPPPSGTLP